MTQSRVRAAILLDGERGQLHHRVLATLPKRWEIVADGPCDAAVVDGKPDALRAALDRGARLIFADRLPNMPPSAIEQLHAVAAGGQAQVVVVSDIVPRLWADAAFAAVATSVWSLIDSVAVVSTRDAFTSALFEQLTATRLCFGAIGNARFLHLSADQYLVEVGATATVLLSGVVSSCSQQKLSIDAVSVDRRIEITAGLNASAVPAIVSVSEAAGTSGCFPVHQNGYRLAWAVAARRLHRQPHGKLVELADVFADIRTVASIFETN